MWCGCPHGKWRNSQCNFFLGHPLYMVNLNPMFLTENIKLWWYRFYTDFLLFQGVKLADLNHANNLTLYNSANFLLQGPPIIHQLLIEKNFLSQNWDCPEIAICNVRRSRSVPNNLVSICSMHPIGRFSSRLSWYLCSNFSWPCQKRTHTDLCFVQSISVTWS